MMNGLREQNAGTNSRRFFWGMFIVAIAGVMMWHAWNSSFDRDEIEHLHAAWLIAEGARPFADFMEQHHPTLWYALAPLTTHFTLPHHLVFVVRVLDIAALLGLLLVLGRIIRMLWPTANPHWPLLLLTSSFMFTRNMMEVRPDPWMTLFLFAGIERWFVYRQTGRSRDAWFSGLCLGLAAVILQKALATIGLLALATFFRKGFLRVAIATLIPLAGLFVVMFFLGIFDDFFFWNYTFNRFFYLEAQVPAHFSPLETWGRSIAQNAVLWVVGIVGLTFMIVESVTGPASASPTGRITRHCKITLFIITAGQMFFIATNRFPLAQYFLVLLPLLALGSVEIFQRASRSSGFVLKMLTLAMTTELIIILLAYPPNTNHRAVQEYVLQHTTKEDRVFIPRPYHPVFRHDSSYFWYSAAMIGKVYEDFCSQHLWTPNAIIQDVARWQSSPPRFVLIDPSSPKDHPYRWTMNDEYEETSIPHLLEFRGHDT